MKEQYRAKEPPEECIIAGYLMTKARMNWPDGGYLGEAIDAVKAARDLLVSRGEIFNMQTSEGLYFLNEAAHAQVQHRAGAKIDRYRLEMGEHAIGRAHESLRQLMKSLGYRDITNRDFAKHGDGGGR